MTLSSRSHPRSDSEDFEKSSIGQHIKLLDTPEAEEDPQEEASLTSVYTKYYLYSSLSMSDSTEEAAKSVFDQ